MHLEVQGLCTVKNGYSPLTQCTVHMEKNDREESNYLALRLREFPLIKLLQNHKAVTLKILNCSKLHLFFISLVFRLQLECPDALLDITTKTLTLTTVCISAHARTETSRISIQNF